MVLFSSKALNIQISVLSIISIKIWSRSREFIVFIFQSFSRYLHNAYQGDYIRKIILRKLSSSSWTRGS